MKVTIRNTQFRDNSGQMVGSTLIGNGSIADEVDSWLENNPEAIASAAADDVADWLDENITQPTDPVVDATLMVQGAAADAKKTGDEISDLKSAIETMEAVEIYVNGKSLVINTDLVNGNEVSF